MLRILLISESKAFLDEVAAQLPYADAITARTESQGLLFARRLQPDLIVVASLPVRAERRLLHKLRSEARTCQIPILTGAESVADNDTPTNANGSACSEVCREAQSFVRRIESWQQDRVSPDAKPTEVVEHLDIKVDPIRHLAVIGHRKLDLTRCEFRLLECFLRNPGHVLSRRSLLEQLSSTRGRGGDDRLYSHIGSLRRKLGDSRFIETVWGTGFRFRDRSLSETSEEHANDCSITEDLAGEQCLQGLSQGLASRN
jgi:DNA-binding response OmpR family regulator